MLSFFTGGGRFPGENVIFLLRHIGTIFALVFRMTGFKEEEI